jgi:hypothetical protein
MLPDFLQLSQSRDMDQYRAARLEDQTPNLLECCLMSAKNYQLKVILSHIALILQFCVLSTAQVIFQ